MNRIQNMLRNIGLSEVESRIYVTLLEYGTLGVSDLAKNAGLHRTEVYRALPHLAEIRLVVRALKSKRYLYSAESPDRIEDLFSDFYQSFQEVMPNLHAMYQKTEDVPKFSYFQGRQAIREANSAIVTHSPTNGCYYRLSSGRHSENHWMFYKENYSAERDKKWLERMIITSEKNRTNDPKNANRDVVAIPEGFDEFDDHISKVIYQDRVTVIDYLSETGFTIQSARYAKYEEKVFKLLFKLLNK